MVTTDVVHQRWTDNPDKQFKSHTNVPGTPKLVRKPHFDCVDGDWSSCNSRSTTDILPAALGVSLCRMMTKWNVTLRWKW